MKNPSTAFAAIPETKEPVMTFFAKSILAVGLIASLWATSAEAFQVPALAEPDAALATVGYQSYYSAPYGYGYNTGYNSYSYRPSYSYGYRPSYGYGYRQSYGYRPSYGYNSYGY